MSWSSGPPKWSDPHLSGQTLSHLILHGSHPTSQLCSLEPSGTVSLHSRMCRTVTLTPLPSSSPSHQAAAALPGDSLAGTPSQTSPRFSWLTSAVSPLCTRLRFPHPSITAGLPVVQRPPLELLSLWLSHHLSSGSFTFCLNPVKLLTVCVSWWLLVFPVNICLLASWWKYIALYSKNFC